MKNIRVFLSENFHFLVVYFSVFLNKHGFVMKVHMWTERIFVIWSIRIKGEISRE